MQHTSTNQPLVLVIDGFKARSKIIEIHLERAGYHVVCYDTLICLYQDLFAAPVIPDLLFVGERLPGVSPLRIIQTLRKRDRYRTMPIVKIGPGEIVPRLLARLAGATASLPAPFTVAHLTTITTRYAPLTQTPDRWLQ